MNRLLIACLCAPLLTSCQQSSPKTEPAHAPVKEAKLVSGIGMIHHPVTTASPEAQKYFDQGLAYIYAFNHAEAVASFDTALEYDPNLAMAHWGRAYALGPNINNAEIDREAAKAAYDASQKALALKMRATESERGYIDAIAKRYSADPQADLHKLAIDYKEAMGQVVKRNGTDLDAATLYAESIMNLRPWKLYTADGNPEQGTEEIVSILEWVLARNPNHTGANHYYIHATEASRSPERAMAAASRLPRLAPNAGHLVHMPAHVFMRTGNYMAAIAANAQAAQVDEKYISCCAPKGGFYPTLYYSHNLHFLAVAAAMAGRVSISNDAATRLGSHIDPIADTMPPAEPFGAVQYLLMVRNGQWGDILKSKAPKESHLASTAAWHFARGMAHASFKDVGQAVTDREQFEAAAKKAETLAMGNNTAAQVFGIARHLLAGKIAVARGEKEIALKEFQLAVAQQDPLAYDEPPAFPWPVRETLGAYLLLNGDAAAAEKVFRSDLERTPNNPRSLFGLARSLEAQQKPVQAAKVDAEFEKRWQGADIKLKLEDL